MLNILYETTKNKIAPGIFFTYVDNKDPSAKIHGSSIAFCGIATAREVSARNKSGPSYLMRNGCYP